MCWVHVLVVIGAVAAGVYSAAGWLCVMMMMMMMMID